jgi:hypothetical protein
VWLRRSDDTSDVKEAAKEKHVSLYPQTFCSTRTATIRRQAAFDCADFKFESLWPSKTLAESIPECTSNKN